MHDLPLASLEMQNVGTTPVESATRRGDRFLHARPPDSSFLPGLDFVTCNREGTQLLELTGPDGATLVSMPPLVRIVPNDQRARKFRQPLDSRLEVALGVRLLPSLNDPPDLVGRFHDVKSRSKRPSVQCAGASGHTRRRGHRRVRASSRRRFVGLLVYLALSDQNSRLTASTLLPSGSRTNAA